MKTPLFAVPLLALVMLSHGLAARAAQANGTPSSPTAPTTLRMRGIIGYYDAASRVLSLVTADGTLKLQLASTIRIRQDRRDIDAEALKKLEGYRAAVRYSESGGNKIAESINVFGRNERTDR
jgi:hypothetical protein